MIKFEKKKNKKIKKKEKEKVPANPFKKICPRSMLPPLL